MSEKSPTRGGPILIALAVLAVGIVAYGVGRRERTTALLESAGARPEPPAVSAATPRDVDPEAQAAEPGETDSPAPEMTAIFEKPMAPAPPPEPSAAVAESQPYSPEPTEQQAGRRDAEVCLRLDATPTHVEAYRAAGPLVQLTVRVQSTCNLSFERSQIGFRISATSADGFEMASAVGRFPGELAPYGSAQTTIDLLCDATRVARYRVQLH